VAGAATAAALALPGRALGAPRAITIAANLEPVPAYAAEKVYFEETGHTVSGPFWRFWRTYGLDGFGYPISEPFEDGGVLNQYFQRARFELTADGRLRLGLLGVEVGAAEPPPPAGELPASEGGGDAGRRVIAETGHVVQGAFLPAYERWRAIIGPPIAPERAVPGGYIQYFAHARLEWDDFNGLRLGLLGSELAGLRGVDTSRVPQPADATPWSAIVQALIADEAERRALGAAVSGGLGFVPEFGEKWIHVSIARQRVTAYEHTKPVFTDLISSGAAYKGESSRGIFAIFRRVANETMDSTTIGYPRGHPKYYRLENVLYTQYYNGGEAIHYAWWHNNFGTPMSYGCINMRLSTAKWFWDWASIGTRVVVA
jgi:hypothetical protein